MKSYGTTPQPLALAEPRYNATAIAFHWTVALLIVFLGALGLLFEDIPRESRAFFSGQFGDSGEKS